MQKNRFGSGNKSKACTCGNCKATIAIGVNRYFDNTTYPRCPICEPCKIAIESKSLSPDSKAAISLAQALLSACRKELVSIIAEAITLVEQRKDNDQRMIDSFTPDLEEDFG